MTDGTIDHAFLVLQVEAKFMHYHTMQTNLILSQQVYYLLSGRVLKAKCDRHTLNLLFSGDYGTGVLYLCLVGLHISNIVECIP